MGELIVGGDAREHRCDLPEIPWIPEFVHVGGGHQEERKYPLVNAVARCLGCGRLYVSREDPDGWGRYVYWARLRWWHRKAIAKLRVLQAAAEGGVAP
jgi:hypothetical protein